MEAYSDKAQLSKFKSLMGGSETTKYNKQAPMTFASNSHHPLVNAALAPWSHINSSGNGFNVKKCSK